MLLKYAFVLWIDEVPPLLNPAGNAENPVALFSETLYPTLPRTFLKPYAERLDSCVFAWDDIMFLVEIMMVPENIHFVYTPSNFFKFL